MANIQIKRWKASLGDWDNLYPITLVENLKDSNDNPFISTNGKIGSSFIPDYIMGQVVYSGIIVTDTQSGTNYLSDNYGAQMFKKVIVNLTTAGKSKIMANLGSNATVNWNSTYPNKAILYYSSVQGVDPDPNNTLPYPAFDFRECTDCYFIFKHPEHGHTAGNSYELFLDIANNNDNSLLSDVVDGDWILSTADAWEKIDNTDAVVSVNGQKGNVTINIPSTLPASDVYAWAKASTKPSYNFNEIGSTPTTLSGYGITDAKIANGVITLGSNSITPLTSITENQVIGALGYEPGTVDSVKVGSTSYSPTNGVISLPAYPTTLPASDVYDWAKASSKPSYAFSEIGSKPTTIGGYGITDAKIASGVITLGSNTITPLTASSTLNAAKLSGTIPASCYTNTTYSDATTSAHGLMTAQSLRSLMNLRETTYGNLLGAADGDICFVNV